MVIAVFKQGVCALVPAADVKLIAATGFTVTAPVTGLAEQVIPDAMFCGVTVTT